MGIEYLFVYAIRNQARKRKTMAKLDEVPHNINSIMDVFFRRGCCYYKIGAYEKAYIDFSIVIENSPKCAAAYSNRAACSLAEHRKEMDAKKFSKNTQKV